MLSTRNIFIKITDNDITFQTSQSNVDGINGLGGITLQGKVINYKISNVGQNGHVNLQVLFSTMTLGHTTLNINFYNDNTCRTRLSALGGLEFFLLCNVNGDYSDLVVNQGVSSF